MPFSTTAKNTMLDSLSIAYASLHSADPGNSGANELSGGSPAYARKAISVGASSSGQRTASTQPVLDVPAGTTVAFVGYWSAVSGGTFLGSFDVPNEVYSVQGTYTITSATFSIN
jgi:hypothetical protein